jgi:hypothetical protein
MTCKAKITPSGDWRVNHIEALGASGWCGVRKRVISVKRLTCRWQAGINNTVPIARKAMRCADRVEFLVDAYRFKNQGFPVLLLIRRRE